MSRCGGAATVAARSCAVVKFGKPWGSINSAVQIATSSGKSVSGPALLASVPAPSLKSKVPPSKMVEAEFVMGRFSPTGLPAAMAKSLLG